MGTLIIAVLVSRGIRIGFYNGNAKTLIEEAQILRPTCLCGVPRIFQRVYDNKTVKNSKNPKISVVISVYNI